LSITSDNLPSKITQSGQRLDPARARTGTPLQYLRHHLG
jgi:hypothetical protein